MDTTEPTPSFVESISDSEITIFCRDVAAKQRVKSPGGKRSLLTLMKWKLHYSSEEELARYLSNLRDDGFAIAGALAGWPPAAVFEQLRDKGKVAGKFTEIIWSQPGKEITSEK